MQTTFEFVYRDRVFAVARQLLLPSRTARPHEGTAFWRLSRLGLGIVVFPAAHGDTPSSIETRFVAWLDERYHQFSYRDVEYELYRIPRDFWDPHKELPAPAGVWEVRRDGGVVTQFPEAAAPSAAAAMTLFIEELATQAVECFGGPLDGERVGDRGSEFEAFWEWDEDVDEDSARRMRRPHQGRYVRTRRGYDWEAD